MIPGSEIRRIGVLGGTFDPVHVGHLALAVNVRHALELDVVLLVVANQPWQKAGGRAITPGPDRLAMVRAAVDGVPGLEASALEVDRGGTTYTADTLSELRRRGPVDELFLVLGADAAAGLATWERLDEVTTAATVVVADRPGTAAVSLPAGVAAVHVSVPRLDVSSTDLRERVADGRPLDFLTPAAVVACIERRGLYRDRP